MCIYKISNFSQRTRLFLDFFTEKAKKNPALCYRAGFIASVCHLELSVAWGTRERYHVANVGHTGYEQQQTFEAQTKT